jgi:site-specific recombinase XerD
MSIEQRNGKWFYRFWALDREWSKDTGLAATERNRDAAQLMEAEARKLVKQGRGDELDLHPTTFTSAAQSYVAWAMGENREHPDTWKRIRTSMTSLRVFFCHAPVHTINVGCVQDYMAWRRVCVECKGEGCDCCDETSLGVKEVTLRHDLHALSGFFRYAINHQWTFANPVMSDRIKIPSDNDAVRFHRITESEEALYFKTARELELTDVHDIGKVMLLQGPRPSEVMSIHASDVDLRANSFRIVKGKSSASVRTLRMVPETRSILETRIASAGASGWLFQGKKKGKHLVSVENAHKAVLEASGLAFVIYDFRHNFATRFSEVTGGDVVALKAILGHANLRTVMRYVHISQAHQDAAMDKYSAYLQKQKSEWAESKERIQ